MDKLMKPEVITLCGSSRFRDEHIEAQKNLTLQGYIVIPMGLYGHLEGLDPDGEIKKKLDQLHFRKIDISDAIFVVNVNTPVCGECRKITHPNSWCPTCNNWALGLYRVNYIGYSTNNEIEYAKSLGKKIIYLNPQENA